MGLIGVEIPHLAYPFRLTARGADVLEQDSLDEITQCVEVLIRTPMGSRIEVPDYGVPDQVFVPESKVDTAAIVRQCRKFEPRAQVALASSVDEFDDLVRNMRAIVTAHTAN